MSPRVARRGHADPRGGGGAPPPPPPPRRDPSRPEPEAHGEVAPERVALEEYPGPPERLEVGARDLPAEHDVERDGRGRGRGDDRRAEPAPDREGPGDARRDTQREIEHPALFEPVARAEPEAVARGLGWPGRGRCADRECEHEWSHHAHG